MQRLQNILIAVDLRNGDRLVDEDLSAATKAAIEQGLEIAAASKSAVIFCYVLELSEQALDMIRDDKHNIFVTVEDFARNALRKLVKHAEARGVSANFVLRTGSTWEQLLRQIDEEKHDLVVIGTRQRSTLTRTIFGSTAQRLLRTANCPVWIVKPEEAREIREIAVSTDMSEACLTALHAGVDIARKLNAKLFVVHSLEFPFEAYLRTAGVTEDEVIRQRTRLRQEAQTKIDAQLAQTDFRTLPHGLKTEIFEGSPDDVIPKFVTENEVDLVILGSHGHTGVSRWLLGNTAERLLPQVHASVLTVRG